MFIHKEKKNSFSLHLFVFKYMIPIFICFLLEFKYFNFFLNKITFFKKKKNHYLSRTKREKKNLFSPFICIQISDFYLYLLSI